MHPSPELFPLQHTGLYLGSESTPKVVMLGRGNFGHSLYFACLGRNGGRRNHDLAKLDVASCFADLN